MKSHSRRPIQLYTVPTPGEQRPRRLVPLAQLHETAPTVSAGAGALATRIHQGSIGLGCWVPAAAPCQAERLENLHFELRKEMPRYHDPDRAQEDENEADACGFPRAVAKKTEQRI